MCVQSRRSQLWPVDRNLWSQNQFPDHIFTVKTLQWTVTLKPGHRPVFSAENPFLTWYNRGGISLNLSTSQQG